MCAYGSALGYAVNASRDWGQFTLRWLEHRTEPRMGRIRVDFSFTVPYDQDLDHIRALVAEILDQDPRVLDTPPAVCTDIGRDVDRCPRDSPEGGCRAAAGAVHIYC